MSTPTAPQPQRAAWLGFAPVAAWVGLRWVLAWQDERHPTPDAWALVPFVGTQDPWGWLRPAGAVVLGLVALVLLARWLRRRHGPALLPRLLATCWVLLWAAACAAQFMAWQNRRELAPEPALAAEIVGQHHKPPSLRSLGGTLWVLRVDGQAELLQVLVPDDAGSARPQLHQRLRLHPARGHWWGRYVTGWDVTG
ncbi:hypothetical protein [Oryzisolibacter sp. LB2S]|uniref:hypothetical protein n=1 Tax=Alicycliphilus soli TaxID=3228789 RepID=UPI003459BDA8